ncbi:MAG: DUF3047 domain-containing protein [Balneola sp.]|nr:MAG: DUF3047 domain-containing protein [Balneola sp.]
MIYNIYMGKKAAIIFVLALLFSMPAFSQSDSGEVIFFDIEDFENELIGDLPENWYNQKGEARPITYTGDLRKTYNYTVMEEGTNKFLRFDGVRGKHLNYPLAKSDVDIYETPILNWKWRIHDIPDGAKETDKKKNDTAASIYVVFDLGKVLFRKVPKSIRYTWSSSLPVGEEASIFHGNQKIVVMGTGEEGLGEWHSFQRNIVEDYRRLFADRPPNTPLAILILSDGDSTNKNSKADYDDIFLSSSPDN